MGSPGKFFTSVNKDKSSTRSAEVLTGFLDSPDPTRFWVRA